MSVNDDIYDRVVDNAAMSRLFENEVNVEANRIVSRHKDRLFKIAKRENAAANPKKVKLLVGGEAKRFQKELKTKLNGHMSDFDGAQLDFHTNNLDKAPLKPLCAC